MDYGRVALVVGLTLVIVVLVNLAIYVAATRSARAREMEALQRVLKQALHPLQSDDSQYQELASRVSALRQEHAPQEPKQHE
jgi:cell division protein FtsN